MAGRNFALNPDRECQAAVLYGQGWSARQIAERFHVSREAVRAALARIGVQRRTAKDGKRTARNSSYRAYVRQLREPTERLTQALSTWTRTC